MSGLVYRNIDEYNKLFLKHLNYCICYFKFTQIFYEVPKSNEGIALLSTHDVHSAFRNSEAMEVCADVESIGRPRQILQSDDHTHGDFYLLT